MKQMRNLLLSSIFAGLLLSGCDKKNDENTEPENNNSPESSLSCKVDGVAWDASLAVVATREGNIVTITGSDSNSNQCFFAVYNATASGTYDLGGSMTNQNAGRWTVGTGQDDTYTTLLGIGVGTVNITELTDTYFKGTFSFTAKNGSGNEVSITSGVFDATFSTE